MVFVFWKHEAHETHEERIKDRLYPAKALRRKVFFVSFGVLSKDCSESKLSPQPIPSSTVASSRMQLYSKLTKSLGVGAGGREGWGED